MFNNLLFILTESNITKQKLYKIKQLIRNKVQNYKNKYIKKYLIK